MTEGEEEEGMRKRAEIKGWRGRVVARVNRGGLRKANEKITENIV
jgi:hypothetical protein